MTNRNPNNFLKSSPKGRISLITIIGILCTAALILILLYFGIKPIDYHIIFKVKGEIGEKTTEADMIELKEVIEKRCKAFGIPFWMREIKIEDSNKIILGLLMPKRIDLERLKKNIITQHKLEFKLVEAGPAPDKESLLDEFEGQIPEEMEVLTVDPNQSEVGYYLVHKTSVVTNKNVENTKYSKDEHGMPAVAFTFNPAGAKRLKQFTSENIGRQLAIILNGDIILAPRINGVVSHDLIITGNFTPREVEELAILLRPDIGLPYPVEIIYEGAKK